MKTSKRGGEPVASKHKRVSAVISLSQTATQKLAEILSAPQTPEQKASIKRSVGKYEYYSAKWKRQD